MNPTLSLLPFLLFAFVASITPGPTNILILSNSARHGVMASLPIVFGGCGGAALLVLVVGLGIGETLSHHPDVQRAMAWGGVLWLTWLAWKIFSSPAAPIEVTAATGPTARPAKEATTAPSAGSTAAGSTAGSAAGPTAAPTAEPALATAAPPRPLGLAGAAGLQLINPKTWLMAVAVVSVFAGHGPDQAHNVLLLSLAFFVVAVPCMLLWACLGAGAARFLRSPATMKWFDRLMALLLLASAWMSLFG